MSRTSINDGWSFTQQGKSERVKLPHTWNNLDGQSGGNDYFRGCCVYERTLKIDATIDQRVHLEFEAANAVATVYVNGVRIGTHKGGYSTFRMDVSAHIYRSDVNTIRVDVDNSAFDDIYPLMGDFTFMGGLYRDAWLIVSNPLHIDLGDHGSDGVYVSQTQVSSSRAELEVDVLLANSGNADAIAECVVELIDADGAGVAGASTRVEVESKARAKLVLTLDDPHLWQGIEDPYLYSLRVRVLQDGAEIDRRDIPTGLRFFEMTPDKGFFLNGRPWRLNGVCRHQCRADFGWAISRAHMEEDMALIAEMGANAIRLAHYQHSRYFYELCDRAGMIVWTEIPYATITSASDTAGTNALSQMTELVKQNYNHSSIVFWGVHNGITVAGFENNVRGIVSDLHELAKSLDPYRLTTQAQIGHLPDDDALNAVTDVAAYDKYFGWYYSDINGMDRWLGRFHGSRPDIAIGISEYGADANLAYHTDKPQKSDYTEEYQALYHEQMLGIFARHPYVWGTFAWNMFDFASALRDAGGVKGRNCMGLVSHDRKTRKDSFYLYKAHWSREPVLHIASKRFAKRVDRVMEVKVYSNEPEVTLTVNGRLFGTLHSEAHVFVFENVPLASGTTHIEARSARLTDVATFERVAKLPTSYTCPKGADGILGSVTNWFNDGRFKEDHFTNVAPLEFPAGRFSIQDRLDEIVKNPEGLALLKRRMQPFLDHPMFPVLRTVSVMSLGELRAEVFTPTVLSGLNQDLVKITKV